MSSVCFLGHRVTPLTGLTLRVRKGRPPGPPLVVVLRYQVCRSCRCSKPLHVYVCGAISALEVRCGVRPCVSTCALLRRRCSRRARNQRSIQLSIGFANPVYIQDTNLSQSRISSTPSLLPPRDLFTTVARSLPHQPHNHAVPIPINCPFVTITYPFVKVVPHPESQAVQTAFTEGGGVSLPL